MLCCAVGVAAVATGAIGWRRIRHFFAGRPAAQLALAGAAAAMIVAVGGFTTAHYFDHAAHAADSTLPTGPLPLCSGSAADSTSIKE
ncbi:MAG TPA: hypothetical protein VJV39_17940 [Dongiaceae bacterium]|nr:hypothetical protein [Dongiaceae bacterium]